MLGLASRIVYSWNSARASAFVYRCLLARPAVDAVVLMVLIVVAAAAVVVTPTTFRLGRKAFFVSSVREVQIRNTHALLAEVVASPPLP